MNFKRGLWAALMLLSFSGVMAQDWSSPEFESMIKTYVKQVFQVTGRVYGVDDFEPEPYALQGANIKVTCLGDTTSFDGMAADRNGDFWVYLTRRDRIKDTRLRVTISYLGMETLDSIFSPNATKEDGIDTYVVELDSVVLHSNPITAQEVEIVEELIRMYQRGDTVIFNADAYEMPTGSVLLDLVRRLPGLKYEDGRMTYLGRDIEEIRLNGDSFFKRDMSIALNNMPTDKLKSLKVYEVPDDTLNRMSDNHLIMDMETKEPMEQTIFTSIAAGTTDRFDRYSISADVSAWREGFGDAYASFSHSTIPYDYSYELKSERTNGSVYLDKEFKNVSVGGSVTYGRNYSENKNSNYNKMFMPEFTQNSVSESESSNGSQNIGGRASTYWRINEHNWLNVGMDYTKNGGHNSNISTDSISNEGEGAVSYTRQSNRSESNTDSYNLNLNYNSNFGKDEEYSLHSYFSYNGSTGDNVSFNDSESRFYKFGDSTRIVNHRIQSPSDNKNISADIGLDRNVGMNGYIGVSYRFSYNGGKNTQNYEDLAADGTLSSVDSLHYDRRNSNLTNTFDLNYYYTDSLYRINLDGNIAPTVMTIDNNQGGRKEFIRYKGVRYYASANVRFKIFSKSELGLGYNGNNGLPAVTQLSTVTDYRDPMNIHEGNSSLKNSFTHSVNIEYQFRSYMRTQISYGTTLNEITTLTRLDKETGARRTSPANINGSWNMSEYLFLTYPFRDLSLSFTANHSFRHNVAYVQTYTDSDLKKSATDYNQLSFSLSGAYSDRFWMIRADAGYSKDRSKSEYLTTTNGGQRLTASTEITYQTQFGLGASTTCRFNKPFGYEMEQANRAECLWNVSLDYSFLKSRQAKLSLTWRDILKSYNGFSASVSGTSWNERRTYGDTSMIVITFSYRFNSFR
jgi:hypothetical protein